MWVNPDSGEIVYKEPINNGTQLDFAEWLNWSGEAGNVDKGQTYRKLYYSGQINYARKFGLHDVTAMGLFSREQWAKGGEFYHYREDWVFRLTYNYASRYFWMPTVHTTDRKNSGLRIVLLSFPLLQQGGC